MSGEWTLGAINAVVKMLNNGSTGATGADQALIEDGRLMLAGIKSEIEVMVDSNSVGML